MHPVRSDLGTSNGHRDDRSAAKRECSSQHDASRYGDAVIANDWGVRGAGAPVAGFHQAACFALRGLRSSTEGNSSVASERLSSDAIASNAARRHSGT
jgi:hypothetical protein